MNYDSQNDGLVNLLDFANNLGIVGIRKEIKPDDFPNIEDVTLDQLYIDEKYQRLLNESMIKKAGQFKPELYSPLRLYHRPDGKFAIFDGQHESVLAAIYCTNPETMTLQAQVFEHDPNASNEECVEVEAKLFKEVNVNRTSVSQVAQLRTDIAASVKEALEVRNTLVELGVHVEKIGHPEGFSVKGYAKLMEAVNTYELSTVKEAIDYYNQLLTSTKSASKWKTKKSVDLQGSMIGGLSAVVYLKNSLNKGTSRRTGLVNFMESELIANKLTPKELADKTAGNVQFVLIARRFVDEYRSALAYGAIEGAPIGEDTLGNYGLGDPSKVKMTNNKTEEDSE
jgi:hypothetical protein